MRSSGLMWLVLTVAVGISMFLVTYKVQDLEKELTAKRKQIARDRGQIRLLEAEWVHLNDPERLRRLSAQYLGFGTAVPQNVTAIEDLPMHGATPQTAPATTLHPATPAGPIINAEAAPRPATTAFQRPAGLPVLLARLQRMLLPEAVGATKPQPRSP